VEKKPKLNRQRGCEYDGDSCWDCLRTSSPFIRRDTERGETMVLCPNVHRVKHFRWERSLPEHFRGYLERPFGVPEDPQQRRLIERRLYQVRRAESKWRTNRQAAGIGVGITGPIGTGKTHLATLFVSGYAKATGRYPMIVVEDDLITDYRATKGWTAEASLGLAAERAPGLFIDDLGANPQSEAVGAALDRLIRSHHRKGAPIFFTSNLSLDELETAGRLDIRTISRLKSRCWLMTTDGLDDYRETVEQVSTAQQLMED
jgi:predicted ATPase